MPIFLSFLSLTKYTQHGKIFSGLRPNTRESTLSINFDAKLSAKEIIIALMNLKKGDEILYHRGFLPKDREKKGARGRDADLVATVALCLANERRLTLTQKLCKKPPTILIRELVPSYAANTVTCVTKQVSDWGRNDGVWNYVATGSR